jgi:hypothetical protein
MSLSLLVLDVVAKLASMLHVFQMDVGYWLKLRGDGQYSDIENEWDGRINYPHFPGKLGSWTKLICWTF